MTVTLMLLLRNDVFFFFFFFFQCCLLWSRKHKFTSYNEWKEQFIDGDRFTHGL